MVSGTCTVQACSSYSNGDDGIIATSTSTTITGCTASFNTGDGLEVPGNCTLLSNTCDSNGVGAAIGAGIKVTGTDCHVDGNTLMRNDLGMDIQLTGNFIVRNTAAGNTTNYQIVANNKVGTIVAAPDSVADLRQHRRRRRRAPPTPGPTSPTNNTRLIGRSFLFGKLADWFVTQPLIA